MSLYEALYGEHPYAGSSMRSLVASMASDAVRPAPDTTVPASVRKVLLRGLKSDPAQRWPSMEALLAALSWERERGRDRWWLGLGVVTVAVVSGMALRAGGHTDAPQPCSGAIAQLEGTWDEARHAQIEAAILGVDKSFAKDVWTRTERDLRDYAQAWVAMHTDACEATTVRGDQSPRMLDLRMQCLHRAQVDLGATIDTLADADAQVVQRAHQLVAGLRPLSRCADLAALSSGVEPPRPEEEAAVEAARSELARADSLARAGRYEAARQAVEAAKEHASTVEYGPVQTEVTLLDGQVLDELGEYEAAEAELEEALALALQWKQRDAALEAAHKLMHVVGFRRRRPDQAMRYRPVTEGLSRGQPLLEAASRNVVGVMLETKGEYPDAEVEHRAALALRQRALGPEHDLVVSSRTNLGNVLRAQERYDEAEAELRLALEQRERNLGPEHPLVASSHNNLGNVLAQQGKYEEAETELRAALSTWTQALGADHPDVTLARNNLSGVLNAEGKHEEAETELRAVLASWAQALGPEHPRVALAHGNLASVLLAQGKDEEAEAQYRRAIARNAGDVITPEVEWMQLELAGFLLKRDRIPEALPLLEEIWALYQGKDDIPNRKRAKAAFSLALTLWDLPPATRDRARARELADEALRLLRETGEEHAEEARTVEQWLAETASAP